MGTLVFPINDDLKRIVEHAEAHAPGPYYGETLEGHHLFLVKDRGCYLMSAGQPGLKVDPTNDKNPHQVVVYADGHNPDKPDYDYDHTRSVCGGDDFGEPYGVEFFRKAIDGGASKIIVELTSTKIALKAA